MNLNKFTLKKIFLVGLMIYDRRDLGCLGRELTFSKGWTLRVELNYFDKNN